MNIENVVVNLNGFATKLKIIDNVICAEGVRMPSNSYPYAYPADYAGTPTAEELDAEGILWLESTRGKGLASKNTFVYYCDYDPTIVTRVYTSVTSNGGIIYHGMVQTFQVVRDADNDIIGLQKLSDTALTSFLYVYVSNILAM